MHEAIAQNFLDDAIKSFRDYKKLAEKALAQVSEEEFFRTLDPETNSLAIIVQHLAGNMLSRWTDFLTADGEKPNRNRDSEFIIDSATTRADVMEFWQRGWGCVFAALEPLQTQDLARTVTIRGQAHTVVEAINRQLTHYPMHIGQIVLLAKHYRSSAWRTLSVPRNASAAFNQKLGAALVAGDNPDRFSAPQDLLNAEART